MQPSQPKSCNVALQCTDTDLFRLQFGLYILFPIGSMYYFGSNLDGRFSVPDFWPTPEQTHKIPFEREEITAELERLKAQGREAKRRRELQDQRARGEMVERNRVIFEAGGKREE